jgi:hypothetical protein
MRPFYIMMMKLKCKGFSFLKQYNHADIIFGGDHGARRFWAVICFTLRNLNDKAIDPYYVVILVMWSARKTPGRCWKKTIGIPLNQSHHLLWARILFYIVLI